MKSRFFFGVFVGFIVASLFFFFFFGVARAQSPKATPQNRVAAYAGYYGAEAVDAKGGDAAYGYEQANYERAYTSYDGKQTAYDCQLAKYESYREYGYEGAAYYQEAAYYDGYATYDSYQSGLYSIA